MQSMLRPSETHTVVAPFMQYTVTEADVTALFSQCIDYQGLTFIQGCSERVSGIAFVRFTSETGAQQALGLNGTQLPNGVRISVVKNVPKPPSNAEGNYSFSDCMINVRNLSTQTNEDSLRMFFEKCGQIRKVALHRDPNGESNQALILFKSFEAAQKAVALSGSPITLDGRIIFIKNAKDEIKPLDSSQGRKEEGLFDGAQNKLTVSEKPFNTNTSIKAVLNNMFAGENNKTASETLIPKRKAQKMFETLYRSKKFADVAFDVQGEQILAHKALLAQESKYFEQSFNDQSQPGMSRVTISDVRPGTFQAMLEYVYCDEIKADENLIVELLELSEKYNMPGMKLKCEHVLGSLIATSNFVKIAKVIDEYQTPKLKEMLLTYTIKNGVDTIDKQELNEVPRSILLEMVERLSGPKFL